MGLPPASQPTCAGTSCCRSNRRLGLVGDRCLTEPQRNGLLYLPAGNTGAHEATLEGEDHEVAQVPWGSRAPLGVLHRDQAGRPWPSARKGVCSWSTRAAGTAGPSRTRRFNAEPAPLPSRRCPRRPFDGKLATGLPADIFLAESVAPDEADPATVLRSRPVRFRNPTSRQVRVPQN